MSTSIVKGEINDAEFSLMNFTTEKKSRSEANYATTIDKGQNILVALQGAGPSLSFIGGKLAEYVVYYIKKISSAFAT